MVESFCLEAFRVTGFITEHEKSGLGTRAIIDVPLHSPAVGPKQARNTFQNIRRHFAERSASFPWLINNKMELEGALLQDPGKADTKTVRDEIRVQDDKYIRGNISTTIPSAGNYEQSYIITRELL